MAVTPTSFQLLQGEIEVHQQRPSILAEHDIARLDVAMEYAAGMGEIEGLAQPCAKPADRLHPVEAGEDFAGPRGGRVEGRGPHRQPVDGFQEQLPVAARGRNVVHGSEDFL